LACHLQIDADPVPDPAHHFDADPDVDADPDIYLMRMRIQVTKMMRIHAGPDTDADTDTQHCPSMNLLSGADGRDNIVGSLILAGNYAIPEVCVYFSHKLIRGNRTIKVTENSPQPPPPPPLL
jgi:hypothetical protein